MATAPSLHPLNLGVTLGDITGVGPEVVLKALKAEAAEDDTRYTILGDPAIIAHWLDKLDWHPAIAGFGSALTTDRVVIHNLGRPPLSPSLECGAVEAGEAAITWVQEAARLCLAGELDGMITAPLSKEGVSRTGRKFTGQTEFLARLAGDPPTAMMLLGHDNRGRWLRVALVTTHLPLKDVPSAINPSSIKRAVTLATQACRDLQLPRARVAVCGLNPHAGEGGLLGTEEIQLIAPTIRQLQAAGLDVVGPLAADTVFYAAAEGHYDAVVAMYHDQGLAPLKLLAFHTGVNWTLGLPFVRTSPDHGTAYNIAGQGIADPSSTRSAIQLARQLARQRRRCQNP